MATRNTPRLKKWYPTLLSRWQQFCRDPAIFLARRLYERRQRLAISRPSPSLSSGDTISIVCVSDTHNTQPNIPDGDVLVHAGDLTDRGTFEELQTQLDWLKSLPHRHKVVIAGNHDLLLDSKFVASFPDRICEDAGTSRSDLEWGDVVYLNDSAARFDFSNGRSLTVFGSPWTELCGNWAFQYPPVRRVWAGRIPLEADIVLTHGPPKGHLDQGGKGCPQLLKEIWRVRPRLVVFGHIHEGYGREVLTYDGFDAGYDGVMMGDKGLIAVGMMACRLTWAWLRQALLSPNWRRGLPGVTILVNAAAVAGRRNEKARPAIVVEL